MEGALSILMRTQYKNKENSRFNRMVRIDEHQLDWLRQNKKKNKCKTMAGFLDKIINNYKNGKI